MQLNYIKPGGLKTGNSDIDIHIDFLLKSIENDMTHILDEKGGISCEKVDLAIAQNSYQLSEESLGRIKTTLLQVRDTLQKNFNISYELRHVDTVTDGKKVIADYQDVGLSIISFNTLLGRCNGLTQAEEIIATYGQKLTFNFHTYTTLYKVLLQDTQRPPREIKDILNTILIRINSYGNLDGKSKGFLKALFKITSYELQDFIQETITRKKLSHLTEITKKPTNSIQSQGINSIPQNKPIKATQTMMEKKPVQSDFEKKLAEARAAGLGDLAYLYASGQLTQEIGGGGKGHRKNGSTFGKGKKEM